MITWTNLLLDRFSFTEASTNEFTLHFYICAYCIIYSSNTSLPARAGIVQISLRFRVTGQGGRWQGWRMGAFSTRPMLRDRVFAWSCCWKDNALIQPELCQTGTVTYPQMANRGDVRLKDFWNRTLCCRELHWACNWNIPHVIQLEPLFDYYWLNPTTLEQKSSPWK